MNIMEFLRGVLPSIERAEAAGGTDLQDMLSRCEVAIREGIAQELEQLVIASAPVALHGIPASALAAANPSELQQDIIRGAANVVRGKDPATEYDWARQAERMKAMQQLDQMKKDQVGDVFPMPSDAELQRRYDDRQDRLREWND
jgi:hypothetical protein